MRSSWSTTRTPPASSVATGEERSTTSTSTAACTSRSARCRRQSASWAGTSPERQSLRTVLEHRSRPFLFSTSHPPAVAAACLAAIDVLETEPELIDRLWENARHFKAGLERLGFDTGHSETPITPVIVGAGALAHRFSDRLFEEGVFAMGIGYPTVPEEKSRVRTIVTSEHSREELDTCLEVFERVGRELAVI